jgi:hypothetical protein
LWIASIETISKEGMMPGVIDHETMYVDDLPGIWAPVQWYLTEEERKQEIEEQARASLLWSVNAPEAILRLLLSETEIQKGLTTLQMVTTPKSKGNGTSLLTFRFRRQVRLEGVERETGQIRLVYDCDDLGYWGFTIEEERVLIERL